MDKTAFVLLLVFSNIVPLLAWGSMAQRWPRRKQAPAQARALHNAPAALQKSRVGYIVRNITCDGGHPKKTKYCVFPELCSCPKPKQEGYTRSPDRWYYDNDAKECQRITANMDGCNNFDSEDQCQMHCMKEEWLKKNQIQ
uniref:Pancreatic trypsin inhibitor n=1 Tax=Rhipicephalus appendiculatus TaxID=34631 RepID=A0A131YH91_RHIAP